MSIYFPHPDRSRRWLVKGQFKTGYRELDGRGDCEEYVNIKRKRLVEAGIPRRALRVVVVIDEENAGHAVLMLRTDKGDFILDNKRNAVLAWHQTGYVFIKRESQDRQEWVALGGVTGPQMALR
jgi:predicted transglutaminase-like cysteine proteinase